MSVKQMKPFMTNVFFMQKIKYQMYRVPSCFNRVIELKLEMSILLEFVAKNVFFYYFDNKTEFLINRPLQVECHLKRENKISSVTCCILF